MSINSLKTWASRFLTGSMGVNQLNLTMFSIVDLQEDIVKFTQEIIKIQSFTGEEKEVQKYHPPWIVDEAHPLVKRSLKALRSIGQNPLINYWKFGTDGSVTAGLPQCCKSRRASESRRLRMKS